MFLNAFEDELLKVAQDSRTAFGSGPSYKYTQPPPPKPSPSSSTGKQLGLSRVESKARERGVADTLPSAPKERMVGSHIMGKTKRRTAHEKANPWMYDEKKWAKFKMRKVKGKTQHYGKDGLLIGRTRAHQKYLNARRKNIGKGDPMLSSAAKLPRLAGGGAGL